MSRPPHGLCALTVSLCLLAPTAGVAQTAVTQATLNVATSSPSTATADSVTFGQRPARVGDRVSQDVRVELDLATTIIQADQVANEDTSKLRRRQQRFIEVIEVAEGRVRRAHVSFPQSRLQSPENDDPSREVAQPIEGKSYLVTRDGERLMVTDAAGAIPPLNEFELVVSSMQTIGLPSPLAKFLLGRSVRIGDRLQLPQDVAQEVLGYDEQLGKVRTFELVLNELQTIDGAPCAVFGATIWAEGSASNPIEMRVAGQVTIHPASCRTLRAELTGPLTMAVTERTPQGNFRYSATGRMRVAILSQYGHAPQ